MMIINDGGEFHVINSADSAVHIEYVEIGSPVVEPSPYVYATVSINGIEFSAFARANSYGIPLALERLAGNVRLYGENALRRSRYTPVGNE